MVNPTARKNYVLKRDGRQEEVHVDKITSRIQKLCYGLNMDYIDPFSITLKVIQSLYPGIATVELDSIAAEIAATMSTEHPDYATLAARIEVSNLHKETKKQFSDVIDDLYMVKNFDRTLAMISEEHHSIVMKNANQLNSVIIYDRDFAYNYFDFKTLERSYLLKINNKIVERPQHMLMRTAVGIHGEDVEAAIETYNYMSERYFVHASATLNAASTLNGQLTSSYALAMPDDSIKGIFLCLKQCAALSKSSTQIGVSVHKIRAKGTYIAGTSGVSNGLVPMLKLFDDCAHFFSKGGSNRPGAFTIYLEPWHADIFEFLDLKKGTGIEEFRARRLYYGLWVPDLFMKRVEEDGVWSLMCPHKNSKLPDTCGPEFDQLYEDYEKQGKYVRQVRAQDLWRAIVTSQMETGTPFMMYKDSCNAKSNQRNLGTIRSSSLYGELVEFSSPDEIGACNQASIAVNAFVLPESQKYDFEGLKNVTKIVTRNLNKIIDVTHYPLSEAKTSSLKHRPIGIAVHGLADTFIVMKFPFESSDSALLNKQIFETIYYAALEASCELAEAHGSYETYPNSPVSSGILQYDLWKQTPTELWNWDVLKAKIAKHGLRNSLLIAPTSLSSQLSSHSESVEPYTTNIAAKHVQNGEFYTVNQQLIKDLSELNLWNDEIKDQIIANSGSVQSIAAIPDELKEIYKTAWEIKQKVLINMAVARSAFVDHSQSLNIYMTNSTLASITSMHFYGWHQGLKTGMTFLKSKAWQSSENAKVGTNGASNGYAKKNEEVDEDAALVCSLQNPGNCDMCGA